MEIIIIMESIAFIAFVYAAILAFSRYKQTRKITNLWLLIAIALFLFSLVSLLDVFEVFLVSDRMKLASEHIETEFLLVSSVLFFSALCLYDKEKKLVKNGVYKKVKKYDKKKFEDMKRWIDDL